MMITTAEKLYLWEKQRNIRDAVDLDVRTRQTVLERALPHYCSALGTGQRATAPAHDRQRARG